MLLTPSRALDTAADDLTLLALNARDRDGRRLKAQLGRDLAEVHVRARGAVLSALRQLTRDKVEAAT